MACIPVPYRTDPEKHPLFFDFKDYKSGSTCFHILNNFMQILLVVNNFNMRIVFSQIYVSRRGLFFVRVVIRPYFVVVRPAGTTTYVVNAVFLRQKNRVTHF